MYLWYKIRDWIRWAINRIMKGSPPIIALPSVAPEPVPLCDHDYVIEKQVWVRIAPKRFELRNSLYCDNCKDRKVVPIC